ncbi:carboxypeptidase-like regulatory domain-containing protein [Carboxylicivirga sp. M1479]|uniref:carboxypeptidase-like regulatory domain-containing protein n=1 Tax=Carboxylicivirga sp. M1479 TaxID=2594476 RepID=UPI0011789E1E|nr:carboxypeptidase-like regulatory domain-containing protein [Carboxylicivirga sp. M1479]TRX65862.1 carboxypeptidase-like regulatory domain-containing protein [Carboxylicivirga sp. M1479]
MRINSIKISLLTLSLFISTIVMSQNIAINGRVVDAETNKPVEFANIGVVGTYMGTATDFDGFYELTVGESFVNYKVQISAVGYQVKEFTVDELNVLNGESIKLFAQTYGIQQIDVKADSKRLYGILKTASNIIEDSYETAYGASVYYTQELGDEKTEAVLRYSDRQGYGNRSLALAYENRNYEVEEVRRNFEAGPIKSGVLFANELLSFDLVRQRGNVLDVDFVDDYKLNLQEEVVVDGDSAWVIGYELEKVDLAKTGNASTGEYKGVIVIRQKDYSVVRSVLEYTTDQFGFGGRGAYTESNSGEMHACKVTVDYRKTKNDKYAVGKISYEGRSENSSLEAQWIVYEYSADSGIKNKQFYTDKTINKDFWSRFSLPE